MHVEEMTANRAVADQLATAPTPALGRLATRLRAWRVEALLLLLVAVNGVYFYNGFGWNGVARLDAIFAVVEPDATGQRTLHINRFITAPELGTNTGDWARNPQHNGNYYSNKPPGTTMLGAPVYAVLYGVERWAGIDPTSAFATRVNAVVLSVVVSVLPWMVAVVLFYWTMQLLHPGRPRWAVLMAIVMACCTLVFPYSTQLMGHSTAAAFVAAGCYFAVRGGTRAACLAGGALGMAVCVEYTAAIVTVLVGLWLLWRDRRLALAYGIGGLLPFAVFCIYHQLCFGSAFAMATAFNNPDVVSKAASGGQFGVPGLRAFFMLTFHPYRGVFWYMPVFLFALPAAWHSRHHRERSVALLALLGIGATLVVNATFGAWHGGPVMGARYMIFALPLYGILLSFLQIDGLHLPARAVRGLLLVTAAVSMANMMVIAAVSPMAPRISDRVWEGLADPTWRNPLAVYYTLFREDQLQLWVIPPIRGLPLINDWYARLGAFNLGQFLGLQGAVSVLPWLLLVGLLLGAIARLHGVKLRLRRRVPPSEDRGADGDSDGDMEPSAAPSPQ